MSKKFKIWFEAIDSKENKEIRSIWADTFKALGIEGLPDEDAAQQSLSKIVFNQRSPEDRKSTVYKGKRAARKRLENNQIFSRLEKLNDPEIQKNIENVRKWLDTTDPKLSANASTTVSELLRRIFGPELFERFIDGSFPKINAPEQPTEPEPLEQPESPPEANVPLDVADAPPEANAAPVMPPVQNPMPQRPAGAELGMF